MEDTKKESKLDVLRQAITDFVNVSVNDLRDSENKGKFVDAFKTILKSEDSGVYAWLEEILPFMKEKADAKGITMNPKEEYETEPEEEALAEPEEDTTPTEEEAPAEPEQDTTEEEAPAEGATDETTPAEDVKAESYKSRNSLLVEMANLFVD